MKIDPAAPTSEAHHPTVPAPADGGTARPHSYLIGIAIGVALVVAIVLRFVTKSDLWLDEALTVNIVKLPLSDLQEALKRDGAPPLYYGLLHGWVQVFGSSDLAVRALSGVLGVAMLGLAYVSGRRIGGGQPVAPALGRVGAVLVVASSPYAIRFSTEARMYVLAMVLVLLGYLAVWRAIEKPTLGRLTCVALATAVLLYTQYWAFFLVAVVGGTQLWVIWRTRGEERAGAVKVLASIAVGGLLFVPWLPTFIYQMQHTGTPWDTPASPPTNIALGVIDFAGGRKIEGWSVVLPLVLLALLALFGRARGRFNIELDLRTVAGVRWEWLVGALTLVVGLTLSFVGQSGFQSRYAAVMYPFFALAVAFGLVAIGDARVRAGFLAVVVLVGFVGGLRNAVTNRTQASEVAEQITAAAQPGDVVAYCPDQVGPDVSRLLPERLGLEQVTFPRLESPEFVDWVDYKDRNAAASPDDFAQKVAERAGENNIWLVWSPGYRTLDNKCEMIINALAASRGGGETLVRPNDNLYEFMGLTRYGA